MAVRGYAKWSPKADAAYWLRLALQVVQAYEDYWPLSTRQIFYRLVTEHGFDKDEKAYNNLSQWLSRGRRAGMVPWEAIRDGGLGRTEPPRAWDTPDAYFRQLNVWADHMQVDRQRGQEQVVELWCEAGGMFPILEGIGEPYSCRINTGGGYDSVTAKHDLATRVFKHAERGLKTIVLHVGDFDPSGENMHEVLRDDTEQMVVGRVLRGVLEDNEWNTLDDDVEEWRRLRLDGATGRVPGDTEAYGWAVGHLRVERVALTGEQVVDRGVETAPPKKTDSRLEAFTERNAWVAEELGTTQISAQLEALTPPELEELISGAIEAHLDMDEYAERLTEELGVRAEIKERLSKV